MGRDEDGDPWESYELFAGGNTREDLGALVAEIFGPRLDGGEGGSADGGAA